MNVCSSTEMPRTHFCWPLVAQKQLDQAREVLTEAQDIWRELGNLPRLGGAYRFMLVIHDIAGDHQRILDDAPELVSLGASTGGRLDQAQGLLFMVLVHAQLHPFLPHHHCPGEDRLWEAGRRPGHSRGGAGHSAGGCPGGNIITLTLAYGHLHLAQGWPEALFAGLEEQVRPFREAGFDSLLADEHWLRGRAALALGQFEAARAALVEARVTAEAQEERAVLWQILATLSELEHACDDTAADSSLRDQAWAVVDDIAAHASELQGAFLSQPAVAQLLGESWRS